VFVVWPPQYTKENKARRVLSRSLIVKTAESGAGESYGRHIGDLLACGEGPRLSMELP
jgi:hypothetical protein